jgi:RsbT co-antagonist protein rsbRD N-terminal domain
MSKLPEMINKHQEEIRTDWLKQMNSSVRRADLMSNEELDAQSRELMSAIAKGVKSGDLANLDGAGVGRGAGHPGRNLRIAGKTGLYHQ